MIPDSEFYNQDGSIISCRALGRKLGISKSAANRLITKLKAKNNAFDDGGNLFFSFFGDFGDFCESADVFRELVVLLSDCGEFDSIFGSLSINEFNNLTWSTSILLILLLVSDADVSFDIADPFTL